MFFFSFTSEKQVKKLYFFVSSRLGSPVRTPRLSSRNNTKWRDKSRHCINPIYLSKQVCVLCNPFFFFLWAKFIQKLLVSLLSPLVCISTMCLTFSGHSGFTQFIQIFGISSRSNLQKRMLDILLVYCASDLCTIACLTFLVVLWPFENWKFWTVCQNSSSSSWIKYICRREKKYLGKYEHIVDWVLFSAVLLSEKDEAAGLWVWISFRGITQETLLVRICSCSILLVSICTDILYSLSPQHNLRTITRSFLPPPPPSFPPEHI